MRPFPGFRGSSNRSAAGSGRDNINNNNGNSRNYNNNNNYAPPSYAIPTSQFQSSNNNNNNEFARQAEHLIPAEIRMISGCHSEQTSADVSNIQTLASGLPYPAGKAGGACTSALLEILYEYPKTTFQQVLLQLRQRLRSKGLDQIPQLTSSRELDVSEIPFSCGSTSSNGIRRAVLCGINYIDQQGQLSGCHNDVKNMQQYLITQQGYRPENILILMDDGNHPAPTRQTILAALRQLVAQSQPGDSAYFHYSGHGGLLEPEWNQFKQKHPDYIQSKPYDETLFPVDHSRAGQIRDFSLFHHFCQPMPAGVFVTCVMDCCHSGSVLDLPYSYRPTPRGDAIFQQRHVSALSNLAFLYTLAGGVLPQLLFQSVVDQIEQATGDTLDNYQGMGMADAFEYDFANTTEQQPSEAAASEAQQQAENYYADDVADDDDDDDNYGNNNDYDGGDGGDFNYDDAGEAYGDANDDGDTNYAAAAAAAAAAAGVYGGDDDDDNDDVNYTAWGGVGGDRGFGGGYNNDGGNDGNGQFVPPVYDCGCIGDVVGALLLQQQEEEDD